MVGNVKEVRAQSLVSYLFVDGTGGVLKPRVSCRARCLSVAPGIADARYGIDEAN